MSPVQSSLTYSSRFVVSIYVSYTSICYRTIYIGQCSIKFISINSFSFVDIFGDISVDWFWFLMPCCPASRWIFVGQILNRKFFFPHLLMVDKINMLLFPMKFISIYVNINSETCMVTMSIKLIFVFFLLFSFPYRTRC